jgi:hypothetical protein
MNIFYKSDENKKLISCTIDEERYHTWYEANEGHKEAIE